MSRSESTSIGMTRGKDRISGRDMSGHPRLAGAVLMIGIVVLLIAISVASVL